MSSSSDPGPEVTGSLGYLLKHAHLQLEALTTSALESFEIDPRSLGVLRVLMSREPTSQGEVAELLGVDRTTMVALLDSLEAKGIVSRRPLAGDRRRNLIDVTTTGVDLYARAQEAAKAAEEAFLQSETREGTAQMKDALHRIVTGHGLKHTD